MAIPAFVNRESGNAKAAHEALEHAGDFDLHLTAPRTLRGLLAEAIAAGVPRVLVAGGDGTIELAAAALVNTPVALAILPGGTLNHFARDHDIPLEAEQALSLARNGEVRTTDVGYVNERLFINTSSVGAYVRFVRTRDQLERLGGYWLASLLAGLRVLLWPEIIPVRLEVAGRMRLYQTPLVFVGVGERELGVPGLGRRMRGGARGLHVVLLRGRRQARRFARAYGGLGRDLPAGEKTFGLDTAVVNGFSLDLPGRATNLATDGEIRPATTPLSYRHVPDALRVVVPAGEGTPSPGRP